MPMTFLVEENYNLDSTLSLNRELKFFHHENSIYDNVSNQVKLKSNLTWSN